ncbi:hypothetical protein J7L67_10525 [bacterium]|nr:hypothetical protein [bacterium]
MRIKSFFICFCIIVLSTIIAGSAQPEKINRDIASFNPDNDGIYRQMEFKKMPKNYAEDFPLYMNMVIYKNFGKIPDIPKIDKSKLQPSQIYDMIKDVFFLGHTYKDVTPEKIFKWYDRNARNAGYERVGFYESGMKDIYDLEYLKRKNGVEKKVQLNIDSTSIKITAFKDQPIKK